MPSLNHIFLKQELSKRYLHFLYHFPQKKFFSKLAEISQYYEIDLTDFIRSELYGHGLVRKGSNINYKGVRARVVRYLGEHPLPVRKRKEKRPDVIQRATEHRNIMRYNMQQLGFDLCADTADGLVLWNREIGCLIVTGKMWCYVYETGSAISWTKNYPLLGYFNLTRDDYYKEIFEVISGKRTWRAWALARRKLFYELRRRRQARNRNIKLH